MPPINNIHANAAVTLVNRKIVNNNQTKIQQLKVIRTTTTFIMTNEEKRTCKPEPQHAMPPD